MDNLSHEYIISIELPKIIQAIDTFWEPKQRGFKLFDVGTSYRNCVTVLYQSSQCKIRLWFMRDRPWDNMEIHVSYGRLHAPVERDFMNWNGEPHSCWHKPIIHPIFSFLDGLSPKESLARGVSDTIRHFLKMKEGKNWPLPEAFSREQKYIWDNYGQRLFALFDLSNTKLWDKYVDFLKEYYPIRDNQFSGIRITRSIPAHMVC
ncbi:MAG: hypothetical protein HN392_09150 [Anaerolineae bacterium]|jgi:hypothetical protein|nr:hypothetical protein [Anaerolineae bacterium]MBT7074395.1 hypothetical protein [Anaerolineae bacterium]MBT7783309.1 hypothetical protein [Anaerolineae bacterium]